MQLCLADVVPASVQASLPGVHMALPVRHCGICNAVHAQQKTVLPQVLSCGPRQLMNISMSIPSRPAVELSSAEGWKSSQSKEDQRSACKALQ